MPLMACALSAMPPALVTSTAPSPVRLSAPVPSPRLTAVGALMVRFLLVALLPPPFRAMVPAVVASRLTLSFRVTAPL